MSSPINHTFLIEFTYRRTWHLAWVSPVNDKGYLVCYHVGSLLSSRTWQVRLNGGLLWEELGKGENLLSRRIGEKIAEEYEKQ